VGSPDGFNAINTLLADAKPPNSHLAASIETLETAPGCPPIPARGSEMVAPSKKNSRDELMTTVCESTHCCFVIAIQARERHPASNII